MLCIDISVDRKYRCKLRMLPCLFPLRVLMIMSSQAVLSDSAGFLWITLTAAAVCLFSSMLILRWSSTHLTEEIASTLRILRRCLSIYMDQPFMRPSSQQIANLKDLHVELVHRSVSLNEMYYQAAFELRIGRVGGELPVDTCILIC